SSFFLLMSPPSTLSTLFPYTTLFRSLCFGIISFCICSFNPVFFVVQRFADVGIVIIALFKKQVRFEHFFIGIIIHHALAVITIRSEEHTSELQSLRHLVCRLLLEKKK